MMIFNTNIPTSSMDQSRTFTKLLRVLQFRKHVKELTSACKRINKEGCYEFDKKSAKFDALRLKKERNKSLSKPKIECLTVKPPLEVVNNYEHLSHATPTSPANLPMIVSQSYKPLHAKSTQFNKNTIAITKDTSIKALYVVSNWVFIEKPETGETGFVPIYCLRVPEPSFESPSQNNISLLNVSIYDKTRYSRVSIINNRSSNISTPPPGRFISSIGPCHLNNESKISTCPRLKKTQTYTKNESILSRQISNVSLHDYEQDAYGTLNITPRKSLSFSVIDSEPVRIRSNPRLRVTENYQRQFVGDISVLESEVVTLVNTTESFGDWKLIKRGDGKQGYIPKHIVKYDEN